MTWFSGAYAAKAAKMTLPRDDEFEIFAAGSNQKTQASGSATVTTGHTDSASRRMLSNYFMEDCCGLFWQILQGNLTKARTQDYTLGKSDYGWTVYHAASPGGNPIYLKFSTSGMPYLCCNMATDTTTKWLSASGYIIPIIHDASADSGSYQVYFDEDATNTTSGGTLRLLAALPSGQDLFIPSSNPIFSLRIVYNATPATPGVAIYYDDGSDERLEFTSPTAANGSFHLTVYDQMASRSKAIGTKGSIYSQSESLSITQILGGGQYGNSSACGSSARQTFVLKDATASGLSTRFVCNSVEK